MDRNTKQYRYGRTSNSDGYRNDTVWVTGSVEHKDFNKAILISQDAANRMHHTADLCRREYEDGYVIKETWIKIYPYQ